MDPDSVKSTLSNLAFGNVMAAAARDYQKVRSLRIFFFLVSALSARFNYKFSYLIESVSCSSILQQNKQVIDALLRLTHCHSSLFE